MATTASLQTTEFATALVEKLNRLGAFAKLEFRVPGTRTILDVYIASPVRAFIEISFHSAPSLSGVQRLLQQAEHVRRQFGGEIVPVLLAGGESWNSSPLNQQLQDAGVYILCSKSSVPTVSSASQCARQIWNFLIQLSYQFKELNILTATSAAMAIPSHPRPAPLILTIYMVSKQQLPVL